jgi:hypothetical protein
MTSPKFYGPRSTLSIHDIPIIVGIPTEIITPQKINKFVMKRDTANKGN